MKAWVQASKLNQIRLLLDYGRRSVEVFEKIFGINFPLPKLGKEGIFRHRLVINIYTIGFNIVLTTY